MKLKYIYCLIFLALSLPIKAQSKKNESIQWLSFEQLSDSLSQKPKKVLLFFHTDWCSYCRKMMRETFRSPEIIKKINSEYYAVHFDAESIDSVKFQSEIYKNNGKKKSTGSYHELAKIFIGQEKPIFPTTILLDKNFKMFFFKQKYLSIREFLIFL